MPSLIHSVSVRNCFSSSFLATGVTLPTSQSVQQVHHYRVVIVREVIHQLTSPALWWWRDVTAVSCPC